MISYFIEKIKGIITYCATIWKKVCEKAKKRKWEMTSLLCLLGKKEKKRKIHQMRFSLLFGLSATDLRQLCVNSL